MQASRVVKRSKNLLPDSKMYTEGIKYKRNNLALYIFSWEKTFSEWKKNILERKKWSKKRQGKKRGNQKRTYCCNLGLYALPEGFNIINIVHGQSIPHSDHAVSNTDGKAACVHRGEGKTIDKSPKRGHGPATIESWQVPALHLKNIKGTRNG